VHPTPPNGTRLDWHRILSGAIALTWLGLAALAGGPVAFVYAGLSLLLPVACIWFADALSTLTTTWPTLGNMSISQGSPAGLLRFCGWVALLVLTVGRVILFMSYAP
jgi:hypothetical protein